MAKRRKLELTVEERAALERVRDHDAKPYIREKAAALLKVADGMTPHRVAQHGLHKPHDPDSIYAWIDRYQSEGIEGLRVKAGRGRKPGFSPHHQSNEAAKEALLHVVRRDPRQFGYRRSRWSLSLLAAVCDWLHVHAPGSVFGVLMRLRISYKQGRDYVHSPDPHYEEKRALIEQCRRQSATDPVRFPFLYLDEVTYYRQPTVARDYEAVGRAQPLARRSYHANTWFRIGTTLDHFTGRVVYRQRSSFNVRYLSNFYADVVAAYPDAETIYVVLDNWPMHFHPDVLARLRPQHLPWPPNLSGS